MSGALQWQELMQIATGIGFAPPVLVKSVVFESDNSQVTEFLGSNRYCLYCVEMSFNLLLTSI